ncbi:MAG: DUF6379 domain-containing protein [Thermoleophilia bacterium]|nr:DUF6379 domain-containing protein [Gaiellaceae bacterium]MDW8339361.1 DUF6379 domain-containing protein [Thermoleophilia bacterium]
MPVGPLDKDVVRSDALSARDEGYALEIRSHWYRALPLTSLAVIDLTLDGRRIDPADLVVEANGKRFRFQDLEERFDEWWFTTDPITLHIPAPGAERGGTHRVELELGLRIPYLLIGGPDGEPLLASSHTDKTLVCA